MLSFKIVLFLVIFRFDSSVAITYYGKVTTPIDGSFILNQNDRILSTSKLDTIPGYEWIINKEGAQYLEIKSDGNMLMRDANNIFWQSNTSSHLSTQPHSLIVDRCAYLMDSTNTVLWYMGIPPGGCAMTASPTTTSSTEPSSTPSDYPSVSPSDQPSAVPSDHPSAVPTHYPSVSPSNPPSAVPVEYPFVPPSQAPQQFNIDSSDPTESPITVTYTKTTDDYITADVSTELDPLLNTMIWIGTIVVPVMALFLCIALIVYMVKGWKQNTKMMQQIRQQVPAKAKIEKVDDSVEVPGANNIGNIVDSHADDKKELNDILSQVAGMKYTIEGNSNTAKFSKRTIEGDVENINKPNNVAKKTTSTTGRTTGGLNNTMFTKGHV
eukprot:1080876_1